MYKKQEEKTEVHLIGMLAEFREALRDEIEKVKSSGISTIILRSGCPLESNGKGYWYRFIVEYAPTLPAEDELRKCDKYAEMKAYRDKEFMSEEFYYEQIETLGRQIEENNAKISSLEDETNDVQKQINAYEQRSSIGRLFANSDSYARNKNRVVEIEQEKQAHIEETNRIESVRNEQRSILGNLLQYEKQMRLYVPSQDKNTWERRIREYKIKITEDSLEIEKLKKNEINTRATLDKLVSQIEEVKTSYEIIAELQQRFYKCDTELGELRGKKHSLSESATAILDDELSTCARYFAIDRALLDSGVNDLFNELEAKLEQAKIDIEGVNISEAIREKDWISVRLNEITTDLADINSKLSDLERQAIMGAKIVGTTLAKSYLDSTLRERNFDTVILDEASMASIPALWCASYLAEGSIVIVGDFLQLPPIVIAEKSKMAKKWLGTDIFNISGMQELAKEPSTCPKNFVMLSDQFRMESDIADIANMYYGQYCELRSNDNTESRNALRAEFHKETDYLEYLKRDLIAFKKRMIIYSPFMTERRLAVFLPYFADAINQGKKIIVITKDRTERKKELAAYIKCEEELMALGVDVIHKKGMHEKLVFVDSTAVWVGSLNTLSFTGETGEIMHRIGDKEITKEYEKIYDINHIDTAVENKYELKCPICGGEMLVKETDDGGIYWACENNDYTRSKDKPYPIDGVFRCHCGEPYVFSMVNQPRWICPNKSCGGYMAIKEGHLKFDKMVALIPKNRMKDVLNHLAKQKKEKEKSEKEKEKKNTTKNSSKKKGKKTTTKKTQRKEGTSEQSSNEQLTLLDL